MRITVDIEDDVLSAAKATARREKSTVGKVLSAMARRGLVAQPPAAAVSLAAYGIHPLPSRGGLITNELIDRLRGKTGI